MTAEGARPPVVVRLLLDAYEAFAQAADNVPAPGRGGALGRLNSGGWIVAHVAEQQDRVWNSGVQRLPADDWIALRANEVRSGAAPSEPPFDEAREALRRVCERAAAYLSTLDEAAVVAGDAGGQALAEQAARSAAHIFVHAGELAAIASLVGAPDIALPGALLHVRGRGR